MKRKVAKIGPSSLMLSLPSKWCKANNIKQGDEMEVSETDTTLIISCKPVQQEIKKTTVNVSEATTFPKQLIAGLYKAGYDEAIVKYSTVEEKRIIQELLGYTCLGFVIMEEKKDTLFIKDIAKIQKEEFDGLLRKFFYLTSEVSSLSLEIIRSNSIGKSSSQNKPSSQAKSNSMEKLDLIGKLSELNSTRSTLHKHSDACRRIINKYGVESYKLFAPLNYIIEEIEHLTRNHRDMCKFIIENKLKCGKKHVMFLEKIDKLLSYFIKLFYDFSVEKTNYYYKEFLNLEKELEQWLKTSKKNDPLFVYLGLILYSTRNLRGPLLILNL